MKRIASLDGFRALSISLVIVSHLCAAWGARHRHHPFWSHLPYGELGVFIFFVISGYLITLLLLNEFERSRDLDLRRFYFRRFFRIVPPLYLYIFVIAISGPVTGLRVESRQLLTALTFTRNLDLHAHQFMFEHFWSLCIEEQFYLIWPMALLFVLRGSGRSGAAKLAFLLIAGAPIYRIAMYCLLRQLAYREYAYGLLPGHLDALMFGCWGALAEGSPMFEKLCRATATVIWILPVWVFGVSLSLGALLSNRFNLTVGDTLNGAAVLFMLIWSIRTPGTLPWKVLNWRPIVHIGVISYSIYIWQTYFLHQENHTILARFPLNLVCILAAAEVSWWTVERFSRRMRDWAEAKFKAMSDVRLSTGNAEVPLLPHVVLTCQIFDTASDSAIKDGEPS